MDFCQKIISAYCLDKKNSILRLKNSGNLKGTVSRDFWPFFYLKDSIWHMNRQNQFRELFRFREDFREDIREKRVPA